MPSETSKNFFGRLKDRKDYPIRRGPQPTHEQVAEATECFLADGGTIQRIPTVELTREPRAGTKHQYHRDRSLMMNDT